MTDNFYLSEADLDPITGRLTRASWARDRRSLKPSLHIDHDPIERATRANPAAHASKAEIATLIAALEARYRELGGKLKTLRRAHPLARMPGESESAYRKRVPEAGTCPFEQQLVLVWLAHERLDVGRLVRALRDGCQPHGRELPIPSGIKQDETTRALMQPFRQRWIDVYAAAREAEAARVRAIVEATPIDDEAWEDYQLRCDYNDAREEAFKARSAECDLHDDRPPPGSSSFRIFDLLHSRAEQRAPEITRARHAREQQAAE
jgi:hypothetical protein